MTKRRPRSVQMREAARRNRAGVALAVACWFACGFAFLLAYEGRTRDQPRWASMSELIAGLPEFVPDVPAPTHLDARSSGPLDGNEGTRSKASFQSKPPVIAIVIDD